jgi:hypothetical protein
MFAVSVFPWHCGFDYSLPDLTTSKRCHRPFVTEAPLAIMASEEGK